MTIPIAIPMAASAGTSTQPAAGVLYVDSDAFPEWQTGASVGPATFTVTSAEPDAKRLKLTVDGRPEPDRFFSVRGSRAMTQFELTPKPGWHQLVMTVVDADGNKSAPRVYSFGARNASAPGVGKSAAGNETHVGGRFVEADGSPAASLPVAVYPIRMGGVDAVTAPLAKTTTSADGTWSVVLASLPSDLQKWAADNDGVLNLEAVADGVARDPGTGRLRAMTAASTFSTGVAVGGTMTAAAVAAANSAVPSAPLLPVRRLSELPHPPEQAPASNAPASDGPQLTAEQAAHNKPTFFGAPDVTGRPGDTGTAEARRIGNSDYTSQPVWSPSADETSAALADLEDAPGDECLIENNLYMYRTKGTVGYTTVLESHAARDAIGGVDYSYTAGSTLTKGLSYNGGTNWSVGGSVFVGNNFGFSTGFTKGPNWSKEWKVPVAYGFYTIYQCTMISGVKKLVYKYNSMMAEKVAVPSGGYAGVYGADVSSYDTYYGWREAPYKAGLVKGGYFVLSSEHTKGTSGSVTAFGFSVTSTTLRTGSRRQRITAGNQSISHTIFGYEPIGAGMKVFYSY
ncbi:hypothetical protein [Kribbella sp. CA-247076]|uniref:hypothetical protein n=1 Tax=Kribbella sp. CA-247076 TaxID=3239941 RepID=UPI003D90BB0E